MASPLVGLGAAADHGDGVRNHQVGVDGWRDDTFSAVFLVFAVWALVRLHQRQSFANAVAAGVLCGIACLTRITALSFVVPALVLIGVSGAADRRQRLGKAGLAIGLLTIVLGPFFLSCAIATGDPFIAINYHTRYYRYSEGLSNAQPMSATAYVRQKFVQHPIATTDVGTTGLIVRPYVTKWNGLDPWRVAEPDSVVVGPRRHGGVAVHAEWPVAHRHPAVVSPSVHLHLERRWRRAMALHDARVFAVYGRRDTGLVGGTQTRGRSDRYRNTAGESSAWRQPRGSVWSRIPHCHGTWRVRPSREAKP